MTGPLIFNEPAGVAGDTLPLRPERERKDRRVWRSLPVSTFVSSGKRHLASRLSEREAKTCETKKHHGPRGRFRHAMHNRDAARAEVDPKRLVVDDARDAVLRGALQHKAVAVSVAKSDRRRGAPEPSGAAARVFKITSV